MVNSIFAGRDQYVSTVSMTDANGDDDVSTTAPDSDSETILSQEGEVSESSNDDAAVASSSSSATGKPNNKSARDVRAIVQKLHVNTGHASKQQMLRLCYQSNASKDVTCN